VDGKQASVMPKMRTDEIDRARRRLGEIRPAKRACRDRQRADGKAVPCAQNLFVAARPDARIACFEQARPRTIDVLARFRLAETELVRDVLDGSMRMQVPAVFEVRRTIQSESARERLEAVRRNVAPDFVCVP